MKNKSKIMESAGKTLAGKLLSLQSRKLTVPSATGSSRRRLRMQHEQATEISKLRKHILDKIRIRQLARKPVSLKFVIRETKKRLKDLESLDIHIMHRGSPFQASMTWCWRLLILSGEVSRARGCKRATPPDKMAASIRHFTHFVREKSIPASLEKII